MDEHINRNKGIAAEDARIERAILVGIERPGNTWPLEESLDELERLTDTAGASVVARASQKLEKLNPRTFVGSGKAIEISQMVKEHKADLVIFDDELTPSQQSNLEKIMGSNIKVLDRTALILDIFALHATSREGVLQVKLAQNEYLLPRLRGMWAHLASHRMGGGVGSRFGEGESQLEVDRRLIRKRITTIKRELDHLAQVREIQRANRYGSGVFKVALAGYTNAGKSSVLNKLTDAGVLSYDKLFATLDSTTRKFTLPEGREITLTDTVGFIQKLPTTLVEAFKSTLDEITGADLILQIIDASSIDFEKQIEAVGHTLEQINANEIPRIQVFNKIDLLENEEKKVLSQKWPAALFISAKTGEGFNNLINHLTKAAAAHDIFLQALIPYTRGDLISLIHKRGSMITESHTEEGTQISFRINADFSSKFDGYIVCSESTDA